MDGPNLEIEHHDRVLKRLGRKRLEPLPKVSCPLQRIAAAPLCLKVSAAAT
jgi:hypothetical protein